MIIFSIFLISILGAISQFVISGGFSFWSFIGYTFAFFVLINVLIVIFSFLVGLFGKRAKYNRFIRFVLKFTSNYILNFLGIKLVVKNYVDLPTDRGFVLIGNHQSALDIILVYFKYAMLGISVIAKKELFKVLYVRQWLFTTKTLVMDREDQRQSVQVILDGAKRITEGSIFMIFPEGTRTRAKDGAFGEFKAGSFKLASKAKADIYPFVIHNLYNRSKWPLLPKKIYMAYLKPLKYEDYKDLTTVEISEIVKKMIHDEFMKGYKEY